MTKTVTEPFQMMEVLHFYSNHKLVLQQPTFFPFLIVRDDGPDQIKKQKDKQNKNKSMK